MRLLLQHWWGNRLKAIVYLDDGIVVANGEQAAIQESAQLKYNLEGGGFIAKHKQEQIRVAWVLNWSG